MASDSQGGRPLSEEELQEMVARLRLGDAPLDVFDLLQQRVPIETFRLFCTTLSVNWEVGGGLAHTLASIGQISALAAE